MTTNTNQYQVTNNGFRVISCNGKVSKLSKLLYTIMLNMKKKKSFFMILTGFNNILVSVVHPDLFRTGSVSNPNAVKMNIS